MRPNGDIEIGDKYRIQYPIDTPVNREFEVRGKVDNQWVIRTVSKKYGFIYELRDDYWFELLTKDGFMYKVE